MNDEYKFNAINQVYDEFNFEYDIIDKESEPDRSSSMLDLEHYNPAKEF
jgi:hypothetical protein